MWATGTRVVSLRTLRNRPFPNSGMTMPAGTLGTVIVRPVPKLIAEVAALKDTFAFWVVPEGGYSAGWAMGYEWKEVPRDEEQGSWGEIAKETGWNPLKDKESSHGR